MGDPLSIAVGVGGLVSLGLQATEYLIKYYNDYRHRDADLARTTDLLEALLQSLRILDEIIQRREWRADDRKILGAIESSVFESEEVIHGLQEEVHKLEKGPRAGLHQTVRVSGRRIAYPLRKSTLEKLAEDVGYFRQNLSVALQLLQIKDHQVLQSDLEEIKHIVKTAQAHNIATGVHEWLNAPNATIDYNGACAQRHPGTGQWFVQSTTLRIWLERDNSCLWLYGFAGCGKSVLCSTAIQHVYRHVRPQRGCAIGFFFFTFRDDSKQDASAFLRALLLQLSGQIPGFELELVRLRETSNRGMPPVATLLEYLRQAILRSQHVYLLLDALDESPEEVRRADVLSAIQTMRAWSLPSLHLLVTSRDLLDIRQTLNVHGDNAIELKNDNINEDISRYVSHKVEHDPQLLRWGTHRETIKNYLSQKAGGV